MNRGERPWDSAWEVRFGLMGGGGPGSGEDGAKARWDERGQDARAARKGVAKGPITLPRGGLVKRFEKDARRRHACSRWAPRFSRPARCHGIWEQ
jgi:hypothetical protein